MILGGHSDTSRMNGPYRIIRTQASKRRQANASKTSHCAMRFFSEKQIRQLLKPDEVIRAIRDAFARDFHNTLRMPVRTQLELSSGVLLLMPGYDSAINAAGVKM